MYNGGGGGSTKSSGSGEGPFPDDTICRDFLKNICNRGTRCKFKHPEDMAVEKVTKEALNFCNDYQNAKCVRDNCRFVHALRADVENYKRTGNVSQSLAKAIAAILPSNQDKINGTPICKEWLTGNCSRGPSRCRYWHVNPEEEREARLADQRGGGASSNATAASASHSPSLTHSSAQGGRSRVQMRSETSNRGEFQPRRFYSASEVGEESGMGYAKRRRYEEVIPGRAVSPGYVEDLEAKNAELIREMDTLKAELARQRERYEDLYYLHTRGAAATSRGSGGVVGVGTTETSGVVGPGPVSLPVPVPVPVVSQPLAVVSSVGAFTNAPQPQPGPIFTSGAPPPQPGVVQVGATAAEAHQLVASLAQQVATAPPHPIQVGGIPGLGQQASLAPPAPQLTQLRR